MLPGTRVLLSWKSVSSSQNSDERWCTVIARSEYLEKRGQDLEARYVPVMWDELVLPSRTLPAGIGSIDIINPVRILRIIPLGICGSCEVYFSQRAEKDYLCVALPLDKPLRPWYITSYEQPPDAN